MKTAEIKVVLMLVIAHMCHRPARMVLTLASTIAATCIVVWVVSSYDSLAAKFDEFADNYLGRYEFIVLPSRPDAPSRNNGPLGAPPIRMSSDFIAKMKEDPAIAVLDPIVQVRARITKAGAFVDESKTEDERENVESRAPAVASANHDEATDRSADFGSNPAFGRRFSGNRSPMLIGTMATEPPYRVLEGHWLTNQSAESLQAVISSDSAKDMKAAIGDELSVSGMGGRSTVRVKIVGVIEQRKPLPSTPPIIGLPAMRGPPLTNGPASAAVYVNSSLAEKIAGVSNQFDYAGIVLKRGSSLGDFQKRWTGALTQMSPPSFLRSMKDVEVELDQSVTSETVRAQAYSATGISLLAALFIIFSTLSMGVDERVRQFAVLRAVTFTKLQVALMIVVESLLLGLIGWGGGLLAGWAMLSALTKSRPELFPVGSSLGTACFLLSGVCSVGGAFAASAIPSWKATRVSPLEGMSVVAEPKVNRVPWVVTLVGAVLITVNPLVVFWVPMLDQSRYLASAAIGCTCMGIGFILTAPATVIFTERVLGHLVAFVFRVNPKFLATQLTTNLWRTLGATSSLTLGLGLFIGMQTWGYAMLAPFTPGDWVPDFVVSMSPTGIPDSEVEAIRHIPGILPERSLPCVTEQVKFATDVTGAKVRATSSRQDNCVMVGIDPELGLGGDKSIFDFTFVRGNRQEALSKLKQGRYCLVPDHFERESGLSIGEKFGVLSREKSDEPIEYEIAGVVSMTGWHWMSKVGLRNNGGGRSAGLMFADIDQVRRDFHLKRINAFWLNGDGTIKEDEIKSALQVITERNFDPTLVLQGRGRIPGMGFRDPGRRSEGKGDGDKESKKTTVNIRSREGVRVAIRERADGIIWLLSRLPLVTLLVTSLGIVNTIVASIRARQWDLGVMRAVGMTRFNLFRLILCEAVLVGVSACLLSFGFGVMAGYCGTGVTRYVNVRGGQIVPVIIPWPQIAIGFSITLTLCLVAALWPAIRTGRTEPLRLLQAGRTAT